MTPARFFQLDPDKLIDDFSNAWCIGRSPAGIALDANGRLALANGDRDKMAVIWQQKGNQIVTVHVYDDLIQMMDHDGDTVLTAAYDNMSDAFRFACQSIDCPLSEDPKPKI